MASPLQTETQQRDPVEIVKELYTSDLWKHPEEKFHKIFHPEYKQYWHKENKYITYDYKQAYDHTVKDLKGKYTDFKVYFSHVMRDGDLVFVRYVVQAWTKEDPDHPHVTPMMALWQVKDNKLYRCWEMSAKPEDDKNVFESFPSFNEAKQTQGK